METDSLRKENMLCNNYIITAKHLQFLFYPELIPSAANRNAMQTHLRLPSLRFTVHTDCLTPVEKKKTLEAFEHLYVTL